MPKPLVIPEIKGLGASLAVALERRGVRLADVTDAVLSRESLEEIKSYAEKIAKKRKKEDADSINAVAILIANKITQVMSRDQELSRINARETLANFKQATAAEHSRTSLGDHLAKGGSVETFGWADESLATVISDLVDKDPCREQVTVIGPLQDLEQAKMLAQQVLAHSSKKTDAMAFVRTDGNHWQLVHAEKTDKGSVKVEVFNPIGDGACGHRAAAECMQRLKKKHGMPFGLRQIVPSNGEKSAVMQQVVKLYKQVEVAAIMGPPASAISASVKPATPVAKSEPLAHKDVQDEAAALRIAESELVSTHKMLSSLAQSQKRETVIASQQRELDYYAQLKADHTLSTSLQAQDKKSAIKTSTRVEQIASDEAYARQLQATLDKKPESIPITPATCRQATLPSERTSPAVKPPRLVR